MVVAARVGADALSTTALSLAIIAFVAQLIVYIAQTSDMSEMRRQASDVNASTKVSLAQIGTTVDKAESMILAQNSRMLDGLLGRVKRKQKEMKDRDSSLDISDVISMISSLARKMEADVAPEGHMSVDSHWVPFVNNYDSLDDSWAEESFSPIFGGWPPDGGLERVHTLLRGLDPISVGQLIRFGEDWELSKQLGTDRGLIYFGPAGSPFARQLVESGLVKETDRYPQISAYAGFPPVYATLTEDGVLAAKLVMARGAAPDHIKQLLVD